MSKHAEGTASTGAQPELACMCGNARRHSVNPTFTCMNGDNASGEISRVDDLGNDIFVFTRATKALSGGFDRGSFASTPIASRAENQHENCEGISCALCRVVLECHYEGIYQV